jgi:hypothetical protein
MDKEQNEYETVVVEATEQTPTDHLEEEVQAPKVEEPDAHKEDKRRRYNAYHREYYRKNKEKFNKPKPGQIKKRRGERGLNKNLKYKLSIVDLDTNKKLISQDFKTLKEISEAIKIPSYTVRLIANGKYKNELAKQKKTRNYKKFLIERL